LARDLIMGGHNHIAVVESLPRSMVGHAAKQAATRYGPEAIVSPCTTATVLAAIDAGATAIICDAIPAAREVRRVLDAAGVQAPRDVSLAAIGCCDAPYPCSGQYVSCADMVSAVMDLIGTTGAQRPAVVWMVPKWVDQGTTGAVPRLVDGEAA
jgi:hypothetical protein